MAKTSKTPEPPSQADTETAWVILRTLWNHHRLVMSTTSAGSRLIVHASVLSNITPREYELIRRWAKEGKSLE